MRIDCDKCGAAFTIDDALISDRGVRAQCPRCGQQKVVKGNAASPPPSPPSPPPPSPPSASNPFAPPSSSSPFAAPSGNPFAAPGGNPFAAPAEQPFGAPAAGANPFAPPSSSNPFAPPSSSNPFAPPAAAANPFAPAAANPFGTPSAPLATNPFGTPSLAAASAAPNPFAAPVVDPFSPSSLPPSPAADPFASVDLELARRSASDPAGVAPDPFAARADLFGAPDQPVSPPSPSSLSSPPSPAADPFAHLAPAPVTEARREVAVSGKWVVRPSEGAGEETVELAELRERLKRGEVGADDVAGPVGGAMKAIKDTPMLAVSLPGNKGARVKGAIAKRRGIDVPRPLVWAAAAALVVGGGGFAAYKLKPELFERQSEAGENPLRGARAAWQRQFPDVQGTAQEHVVEGRKQMRLDTAAGYRKADDELRQALLLDVGSAAAIAAWAENLANLPGVRADADASSMALDGLAYALKREPENVELLRAQGAMQLALGHVDDAQRTLGRALKVSPGDVDCKLWMARSDIDRNAADALDVVQREVRARDPDNKVAYTVEGAARRRLGNLKEARELLSARLVSDPQNVGALREMARLELDVGQPDAALSALTTLLSAEDKDVESHLLRAKIHYQIKGGVDGLKAADGQLDELLARHEADAGDLLVSVLAHATFVKTQLGNLDRAIELGERARKLDGNAPSPLYALGRAYAAKGDFDNAKKALDQAVRAMTSRDQFYEPLVRAELASVQGRSGDVPNAIRNGERAIEIDRLNLRAYFGLAALYAKDQKFTQAMTIMRKTLANDPAWEHDRRVPTDYPTQAADVVAFADVFKDAKPPPGDESLLSLKYSSEGMIRYSAGQRDEAETLLRQALKSDPQNQGAVLYLSIIELEKGRTAEPRERLREFIASTASQHPVTLLYMGRAEAADGDLEAARKRLGELAEAEPTLVQARYSLGMVMRAQKLEAQASEELRAVVKQDPDFLPAKHALDEKG